MSMRIFYGCDAKHKQMTYCKQSSGFNPQQMNCEQCAPFRALSIPLRRSSAPLFEPNRLDRYDVWRFCVVIWLEILWNQWLMMVRIHGTGIHCEWLADISRLI